MSGWIDPCGCEWQDSGSFHMSVLMKECAACAAKDPFEGLTEEDQING